MSAHPDNIGPNRCGRAAYEERITAQGYPYSEFSTVSPLAIARAIRRLPCSPPIPERLGPPIPKNWELQISNLSVRQ